MRKQSQMGCSKYEFNPEQFEIDIQNKILKHQQEKQEIHKILTNILRKEPFKIDQTFSTILEVLRELKAEYKI